MDTSRSQQYNFCYEALPALFYVQTSEFIKYLERDGEKFLRFWWDHVGAKLPAENARSFDGMSVEWLPASGKLKLALIHLPAPLSADEMAAMFCAAPPERRFAWVRLDQPRLFGLIPDDDQAQASWVWGTLTPRGRFIRQGHVADPGQFADAVIGSLNKAGKG